MVLVEGDQEIVPGLSVMLTPGHSPGGQSVVVNTKAGKAIITGFCCNEQNFPSSGPLVPCGVHLNLIEAYDSIHKVKAAADLIIPIHDLSIGRHATIPE